MQATLQPGNQTRKSGTILVVFFLSATLVSFYLSASTTVRAFKRGDDRMMQIFDSGVYITSANSILKVAEQNKRATPNREDGNKRRAELKKLAEMLIIDGPVLPSLAAAAIALGNSFQQTTLVSLAILESSIQALITALVFILTWRITHNKFLALAAGLVWAIYPPAIIATQKLSCEIPSAALLLFVLLCFDLALTAGRNKFRHRISFLCAGAFFALLLLTKPVLMFASLLPFLFVVLCTRGRQVLSGIISFILATVLTMMPFWIFTQQTTGQTCYLPQRMPTFNAIVANNLVTDGLQGLPQPPVSDEIASSQSILAIELSLFSQDPLAHTDLNIRKIPRLFAEPWNDLRHAAILRNPKSIRLVHQLLGAFEFLALVLAFSATIKILQTTILRGAKESEDAESVRDEPSFMRACQIASMLFLAVCGHLIYVAFEGIPRYGFTAAPLLLILLFWLIASVIRSGAPRLMILNLAAPPALMVLLANFCRVQDNLVCLGRPSFSAVFLAVSYTGLLGWMMLALVRVCQNYGKLIGANVFKSAAAISFFAFSLTVTLSIIHEAKEAELVFKVSGPVLAAREMSFATAKKPDWALLIIDSDKEIAHARINVNGHRIHEIPRSVYNFYQRKFDLLAILEELATDLKISAEDVRQWRAVPLPVEYLNLDSKNKITVCSPSGKPITVYGDYAGSQTAALPTFEYLSHSRIYVDATSCDWRPRIKFQTSCPSESFIESNKPALPLAANQDLSSAPGIQKGHWRFLIAVGYPNARKEPAIRSESKLITLDSLKFQDADNREEKVDKTGPYSTLTFNTACRADCQLNAHPDATHVIVELKGKARAEQGKRKQALVAVALHGSKVRTDDATRSSANQSCSSYFDCKGQPKPESVRFPNTMQMLFLDQDKSNDFTINGIYPLDAVRNRGDHLSIEFLPVPEGTGIKLEDLQLSVREIAWPDLGRGAVAIY